MRVRPGPAADRSGALYMAEAVVAAIVTISTLACLIAIPPAPGPDGRDDLELMSADLLCLLEHSGSTPAHPGLAPALSSRAAWDGQSPALESDLHSHMPQGCRAYLRTPYGDIGDRPPDGVPMSVRPFLAYLQEAGEMVECSLIVWRP